MPHLPLHNHIGQPMPGGQRVDVDGQAPVYAVDHTNGCAFVVDDNGSPVVGLAWYDGQKNGITLATPTDLALCPGDMDEARELARDLAGAIRQDTTYGELPETNG